MLMYFPMSTLIHFLEGKKKKGVLQEGSVSYGVSHEVQTKIGLKYELKLPGMNSEL